MLKLRKTRGILARRAVAAGLALGTMLAAAIALAPTASANGGGGCRGFAYIEGGISLDSCSGWAENDPQHLFGQIGYIGVNIDPCAQLVNADTHQWVHDFGCLGWSTTYTKHYGPWMDSWMDVPKGRYYVQVGAWVNYDTLHYIANVQSPVVTVS
ncbi:hypothetical protein AB0M29_38095 [Streptomyces sp. NPDC051976]|uniref:hypothetical protein n=1 Tax=Streptomyces sp. NPDC051976 TaxID=3154947 RepID=UPI00342D53ED